jgi:tRNA pseudouridine55 synthase
MGNRGRSRDYRDVDGILILDKPIGCSSNQALQQVRKLYQARKAGHCGSLDPLASGVLPVCLGEATKFSSYLLGANKTYRATCRLGETTTTGDAEGEVLECRPVQVDKTQISQCFAQFVGEIEQIPPMYSALKHQGGA